MKVAWVKYTEQYQLGLTFGLHDHHGWDNCHCHIWVDLVWGCIEFTFGEKE